MAFQQLGPPVPGQTDVAAIRVLSAATYPNLAVSDGGSIKANTTFEVSIQGLPGDNSCFLWVVAGGPNAAQPTPAGLLCANSFLPPGGFIFDLVPNGVLVPDILAPGSFDACLTFPVPNVIGFAFTLQSATANLVLGNWLFTGCVTVAIVP